jgi:hypothetical protein
MELLKADHEWKEKLTRRLLFIDNKFSIYQKLMSLTRKRNLKIVFFSDSESKKIGADGYYSLGTIGLRECPLERLIPIFAHELGHFSNRKKLPGYDEHTLQMVMSRLPPVKINEGEQFLDDFSEEDRAWKFAERLISLLIKENGGV